LHQWQQQHDHQQQQQQQHITASADAAAAWQQQQSMRGHPDASQLQGESSRSLVATHSFGQQQQSQPLQQQYTAGGGSSSGGNGGGGVPGSGGAGPAPVLCFRWVLALHGRECALTNFDSRDMMNCQCCDLD
jgi:hypothetical protein